LVYITSDIILATLETVELWGRLGLVARWTSAKVEKWEEAAVEEDTSRKIKFNLY
jgi:hypothetical protein